MKRDEAAAKKAAKAAEKAAKEAAKKKAAADAEKAKKAAAKKAAKPPKKATTKGHLLFRKKFLARVPAGAISQAELKQMLPPNSSCWKGNWGSGHWWCHYEPHSRISRSWSIAGHKAAAMYCLKKVWGLWLTDNSLNKSDCPIVGLFGRT